MSRLTGSDAKGLMEAYQAVYAPQKLTEKQVEKTNLLEDFEIDPDALLESVKEYLVVAGYAKEEKEAINMLPHLSENFLYGICSQIIISEVFHNGVNSLIEEGYDLSQYTLDELFESYIEGMGEYLVEEGEMGLQIDLLTPALTAGVGLAGMTGDALKNAVRNAQVLMARGRGGRGFGNKSKTDTKRNSKSNPTDNPNNNPKGNSTNIDANKITGNTGSGNSGDSGAPSSGGNPKKDGDGDALGLFKSIGNQIGRAKDKIGTAVTAVKDNIGTVFNHTLGKPARQIAFGSTRRGQLTRTGGISVSSAADLIPKIAGSDKPSNLAKLGSFGPGVVGNLANLASEIPGVKGSSTEDGLKGAGTSLKNLGQRMWDQKPTPSKTTVNWNSGK